MMFGNVRGVSGRVLCEFTFHSHTPLRRHLRCILQLVLCDILAEQNYLEPEHSESNER